MKGRLFAILAHHPIKLFFRCVKKRPRLVSCRVCFCKSFYLSLTFASMLRACLSGVLKAGYLLFQQRLDDCETIVSDKRSSLLSWSVVSKVEKFYDTAARLHRGTTLFSIKPFGRQTFGQLTFGQNRNRIHNTSFYLCSK